VLATRQSDLKPNLLLKRRETSAQTHITVSSLEAGMLEPVSNNQRRNLL
jgi:hypothetical protein